MSSNPLSFGVDFILRNKERSIADTSAEYEGGGDIIIKFLVLKKTAL
jgi:hypothetical protein